MQGHGSSLHRLLVSLNRDIVYANKSIAELKNYDRSKWKLSAMLKPRTAALQTAIAPQTSFLKTVRDIEGEGCEELDLTQMLADSNMHSRQYAFLNIYETQEDISYKYLGKGINKDNPADSPECTKGACMHPQFGYHQHALEPPTELELGCSLSIRP